MDTQQADVAATPTAPIDPASWTDAQRDGWLQTGDLPQPEDSATSTESAAADEAKPASESATETKPTQETKAKDPTETEEKHSPRTAKRIQELLDKIKALEARPAPSPRDLKTEKPISETKPTELKAPVKPKFDDFKEKTWGEWEEAKDTYYEALADFKAAEKLAVFSADQAKNAEQAKVAEINKSIEAVWKERVGVAKAKPGREDFDTIAFSKDIPISPVMDSFILKSEHGPEVLYRLGSNLEEARRIANLDPYDTAYELKLIELSITKPAADAPVDKKPKAPPKPPPTDLHGRNTAPEDEADQALKDRDFTRWMEIENRRELAQRK